jgi:hypothetical protein
MPKKDAKIHQNDAVNTGGLADYPSYQNTCGFKAEQKYTTPDTGGRKILGLPIASWVSLIAGAFVACAVWFSGG